MNAGRRRKRTRPRSRMNLAKPKVFGIEPFHSGGLRRGCLMRRLPPALDPVIHTASSRVRWAPRTCPALAANRVPNGQALRCIAAADETWCERHQQGPGAAPGRRRTYKTRERHEDGQIHSFAINRSNCWRIIRHARACPKHCPHGVDSTHFHGICKPGDMFVTLWSGYVRRRRRRWGCQLEAEVHGPQRTRDFSWRNQRFSCRF
jgi:hypothetical protein